MSRRTVWGGKSWGERVGIHLHIRMRGTTSVFDLPPAAKDARGCTTSRGLANAGGSNKEGGRKNYATRWL